MANDTTKIYLQTVLDKSTLRAEIKEIQKFIDQHPLQFTSEIKATSIKDQLKSFSKGISSELQQAARTTLSGSDILKDYDTQIKSLTISTFNDLNSELKSLSGQMNTLGNSGFQTSNKLENAWNKFTALGTVNDILNFLYGQLKQIPAKMTELDMSLAQLSKGSGITGAQLANVTEQAYQMGENLAAAGTKVLNTVTVFKRAGYDIHESMQYAEEAIKSANLSGNLLDTGTAADSLVRIMKGFQNETPGFAAHINDAVSQVSDLSGAEFDQLLEGAANSSTAASQAGLSFDQMLGTLAGTYAFLSDIDKAAASSAAIFSRLHSIQEDGGIAVSNAARLQNVFARATEGTVNIIDQENGRLRNTYDVLKDLSRVWELLGQAQQQTIISEAGLDQRSSLEALMANWEAVEHASGSAATSFGHADQENQKYVASINGRLAGLNSAFEKLAVHTMESSFLKGTIDAGTKVIEIIDLIVDKIGVLTPLLAGTAITEFIKNFDRPCNKGRLKIAWIFKMVYPGEGTANTAACTIPGDESFKRKRGLIARNHNADYTTTQPNGRRERNRKIKKSISHTEIVRCICEKIVLSAVLI